MINPLERFSNDPRFKKLLPVIIVILVVFLFGVFVWAASAAKTTMENPQTTGAIYSDTTSLTMNVVVRLMIVLAIIYLCYATYRWTQNRKGVRIHRKRMSVIETVRLSPRQAIHIVRVGSHDFLIGATDQSMNLLSEVENEPVENDELVEDVQLKSTGFEQVFLQTLKDPLKSFRERPNNLS